MLVKACAEFLQELTPQHRSIFILSAFFKKSAREIASTFNLTELHVRGLYSEIKKIWEEFCRVHELTAQEAEESFYD